MDKTRHIYVDYSNLKHEGKHLAGQRVGKTQAPWHCNFEALMGVLQGTANLGRTLLVTSDPFAAGAHALEAGFEVVTYPRSFHKKEKCVDTRIAVEAVRDAMRPGRSPEHDIFVFVSGDLDQQPAVQLLREEGFTVYNLFWQHSSKGLQDSCDAFEALDPHWDRITWCPTKKDGTWNSANASSG